MHERRRGWRRPAGAAGRRLLRPTPRASRSHPSHRGERGGRHATAPRRPIRHPGPRGGTRVARVVGDTPRGAARRVDRILAGDPAHEPSAARPSALLPRDPPRRLGDLHPALPRGGARPDLRRRSGRCRGMRAHAHAGGSARGRGPCRLGVPTTIVPGRCGASRTPATLDSLGSTSWTRPPSRPCSTPSTGLRSGAVERRADPRRAGALARSSPLEHRRERRRSPRFSGRWRRVCPQTGVG